MGGTTPPNTPHHEPRGVGVRRAYPNLVSIALNAPMFGALKILNNVFGYHPFGILELVILFMGKQVGRQQLLDRATGFFRAKGYSATSIDEIVKTCGITKGSLYYHFSGKEELALAAMEQVHRYFKEHIFRLLADVKHPGMKDFEAFNQAVEAFYLSHPDGCLIANLSLEIGTANELFSKKIRDFFSDWRVCYAAVFARGHGASHALRLAEDAVASVQGCILMYRIDGNIAPLQREHRNLIKLLSSKAIQPQAARLPAALP